MYRLPTDSVGARMIQAERLRQIADKGYDDQHDSNHVDHELVQAALAFITAAGYFDSENLTDLN